MGESEDSYDANLLWPKSRLILFLHENSEEYEIAAAASGWRCMLASDGSLTPEALAAALKEE